ncbi:Uncharacterised protein [Streptococcus pneumoniae]|nr:Uncharacterised protein [Streptococcus pneumoniae]
MKPPSPVNIQDSIKNCVNTLPRVAPSALRIPISRVRSVTDTSMMFITPIPPTSKEIAAIPPNTIFIIPIDSSSCFVNSPKSCASNLCSNLGAFISFKTETACFSTLLRSVGEVIVNLTESYSFTPEMTGAFSSDV